MTKFNDFISKDKLSQKELDKLEKINGVYGCQMCDKETYMAYFDESSGVMMWFCQEGHKSGFTVQ